MAPRTLVRRRTVQEAITRAQRRRELPAPAEQRHLRVQAGVSRRQQAEWLHVSESAICRWESGARRPRGAVLDAYLDLLEMYRQAPAS